MIKTKITETTEKYDKDGKLVEKITREEIKEDDEHKSYINVAPGWNSQPFELTSTSATLFNK